MHRVKLTLCRPWILALAVLLGPVRPAFAAPPDGRTTGSPLAGTRPLDWEGDLCEQMVSGVDRFLERELERSIERRETFWQRDTSSLAAYEASIESNRQQFARMIGLRDERLAFDDLDFVATRNQPALVGRSEHFEAFTVRWPVLDGLHGEGLLLEPTNGPPQAGVVVIPDCEQQPEMLVGLVPGVPPEGQIARRLAESGCRVMVPTLVNRGRELSLVARGRRVSTAHHREILYRAAYQMGRHLIGYEVQKVLGAVDWLSESKGGMAVGVVGYGEGGLLALYAAAIDQRIRVAGVSGYFDSRQNVWREPIDRNVFGLLSAFGDAELATLIAPRALMIEACQAPNVIIEPGSDSAPGELTTPEAASVLREAERTRTLLAGLQPVPPIELVVSAGGDGPFGTEPFLGDVLGHLADLPLATGGSPPSHLRQRFEPQRRLARQYREIADFSQRLVDDGPRARSKFAARIDRDSGLEEYGRSMEPYRTYFRDEIIGVFDDPLLPASPRSRLVYDEPEYRGYEVVLDVLPDVILPGILLVPKDMSREEKRPVVVCQHGLEGRAQQTVEGDYTSYRDFAARLARRGFVVFAPQHPYRGGDRFRILQRKANPLQKSLFSVMLAQHRQLLAWLGTLPFIDDERIAFYGISYGGKSAMRIPALLEGYCLSICSSDFSDWIARTVSDRFEHGYLGHSEYEIFEFDLGNTFNYGEMAALICPRPFMVERLHRGYAAESIVAEYARVRLLYEELGIGDRTGMSYFGEFQPSAPYAARETFDFLHDQLHWPRR